MSDDRDAYKPAVNFTDPIMDQLNENASKWLKDPDEILEHDKKIHPGEDPVGILSVEGEGPIHKGDEK